MQRELPPSTTRTCAEALHEYDMLFDTFHDWFAGQYEPSLGGFFHARSSFDIPGNHPDIESSTFAVDIMHSCGIIEALDAPVRRRMIAFFQDLQDRDSRLFFDRNPLMARDEVMVTRAQSFALKALRKLGGQPRLPLPELTQLPEYLASPESMLSWMSDIELTNSWRGCDRMSSVRIGFDLLPPGKQRNYMEALWSFLEEIQDEKTGFWGYGRPLIRLSGTFKILSGLYRAHRERIPRKDQIVSSVFDAMHSDSPDDFCWVRNPVDILDMMDPDLSPGQVLDLVEHTVTAVKALYRPDGGFSREIGNSPAAPNVAQVKPGDPHRDVPEPVILSRGLYESDMNAGTQAEKVRLMLYRFAGLTPLRIPVPERVLTVLNR